MKVEAAITRRALARAGQVCLGDALRRNYI